MLYSCTHMAAVGVKGLSGFSVYCSLIVDERNAVAAPTDQSLS